ncbi:MAG TPA: hypothetical protein VEA69_10510 [Tepidisphaeraceae bacterium]|nr:hypothetical protein [Tepidisphaeraceae bacterium]
MSERNLPAAAVDRLVGQVIEGHARCRKCGEEMIRLAIENGGRLLQLKSTVGHGGWGDFVRDRLGIAPRTIQRYCQLYEGRDAILPAVDAGQVDSIADAVRVARGLPPADAASDADAVDPAIVERAEDLCRRAVDAMIAAGTPMALAGPLAGLRATAIVRKHGLYRHEGADTFDDWLRGKSGGAIGESDFDQLYDILAAPLAA